MKRTQRSGSDVSWKDPAAGQVRVYVWELPVRISHWLIVLTIVSLSITGFYMHSPYVTVTGKSAYAMGTMRFVHLLSGFVFTGALVLRLVWFFLGNRWARFSEYFPMTKKRGKGLLAVGKYYAFMAWSPISYIGHNPMAGAAYLVVYGMVLVEVLTGFALYSQILGSRLLSSCIGWLPRLIDIQWLREIHFFVMFGFWMFFIHHLYTAVLVSVEEESGLMDSIFSGYKFLGEDDLRKDLEDLDGTPTQLAATQVQLTSAKSEAATHTSV
jgi:Ni/Fe-hydrogenase 1 B-type cytochrome subunit